MTVWNLLWKKWSFLPLTFFLTWLRHHRITISWSNWKFLTNTKDNWSLTITVNKRWKKFLTNSSTALLSKSLLMSAKWTKQWKLLTTMNSLLLDKACQVVQIQRVVREAYLKVSWMIWESNIPRSLHGVKFSKFAEIRWPKTLLTRFWMIFSTLCLRDMIKSPRVLLSLSLMI